MKLNPNAFEQIRSGSKTIEVRLYDEKRKKISVGDQIIFSKLPEMESKITMSVVDLLIYGDFESLYSAFPGKDFGGDGWTVTELVDNIRQYYSAEDEAEYGVVGIRLELVS